MSYEADLVRNYSECRARINEAGYRFQAQAAQRRNQQPPPPTRKPTPLSAAEIDNDRGILETILCTVAEFYGVSRIDVKSKRHTARVVRPRHVAMYLCATRTLHSLPTIGRVFFRDHTTAIHARNKIAARRKQDPKLDAELCRLEALFDSSREGEGPPGKYPQHQPGRVGSPGGPTNSNSPGSWSPGDGAARSILPSLAHDDRAAPPVSQVHAE